MTTPVREPSLGTVLASHARQASDARLALDVAAGALGALLLLLLRVKWWWLALPFVALAAFGAWGIADRSIPEQESRARRLVLLGRAAAAVLGFIAAVLFGLALFASMFVGWIS